MKVHAVDIGGSSVKIATFKTSGGHIEQISKTQLLGVPAWDSFERWLAERLTVGSDALAVACAGHVDPNTGINRLCNIAKWRDYPLRSLLQETFPRASSVHVLNDVEAHIHAHIDEVQHPAMALVMGSSMGVAFTDSAGQILRSDAGRPLEFGTIRLATSASCPETWWALAAPALEEEQQRRGQGEGAKHFGYRVGAFCAQWAAAFHAKTVILSGGVVAHNWETMRDTVEEEFRHGLPSWRRDDQPALIASPHGRSTGLVGITKYAANNIR